MPLLMPLFSLPIRCLFAAFRRRCYAADEVPLRADAAMSAAARIIAIR